MHKTQKNMKKSNHNEKNSKVSNRTNFAAEDSMNSEMNKKSDCRKVDSNK